MFFIDIPLAFAGKALFGLSGVFAAAAASNVLMGLIAYKSNRKTYKDR